MKKIVISEEKSQIYALILIWLLHILYARINTRNTCMRMHAVTCRPF